MTARAVSSLMPNMTRDEHMARINEPLDILYINAFNQVEKVSFQPSTIMYKFWLSERAFKGLEAKSLDLKCGPSIASVVAMLPGNPLLYKDERPEELTDLDMPLLEADRFPTWDWEYDRFPYTIRVPRNAQFKLLTISMHFHITISKVPSSYRHTGSRIQAVLEAIGTDLLTFHVGHADSPVYPDPALPLASVED